MLQPLTLNTDNEHIQDILYDNYVSQQLCPHLFVLLHVQYHSIFSLSIHSLSTYPHQGRGGAGAYPG